MKKINIISLSFSLIVMLCACGGEDIASTTDVKRIEIDVSKAEKYMDLSSVMDTSFFQIIPLETRPDCLLGGEINKIMYRNNRIYIWEDQTEAVFMFDDKGNYLSKIQSKGEGPNDYLNISSVSISDDRIAIYDDRSCKVLYYDLDCNFISRSSAMDIRKNYFPCTKGFMVDDRFYFINFYLDSYPKRYGKPYRFCSVNIDCDTTSVRKYAKYDDRYPYLPSSFFMSHDKQFSSIDGQVLLMSARIDTIYKATRDGLKAEYVLDFGGKTLPKHLWKGNFAAVSSKPEYSNYILGVSNMLHTDDYVILHFRDEGFSTSEIMASVPQDIRGDEKKTSEWLRRHSSTMNYYLFIDKKTGDTRLTNGINFSHFGQYPAMCLNYCDGKYLMYVHTMFIGAFENGKHRAYHKPENPRYERALNGVYATLTPESNPVIHLFKFK